MADTDWRGVGGEDTDVDRAGNLVLAGRSRRLLFSLLRPHRRRTVLAMAIIFLDNLARWRDGRAMNNLAP